MYANQTIEIVSSPNISYRLLSSQNHWEYGEVWDAMRIENGIEKGKVTLCFFHYPENSSATAIASFTVSMMNSIVKTEFFRERNYTPSREVLQASDGVTFVELQYAYWAGTQSGTASEPAPVSVSNIQKSNPAKIVVPDEMPFQEAIEKMAPDGTIVLCSGEHVIIHSGKFEKGFTLEGKEGGTKPIVCFEGDSQWEFEDGNFVIRNLEFQIRDQENKVYSEVFARINCWGADMKIENCDFYGYPGSIQTAKPGNVVIEKCNIYAGAIGAMVMNDSEPIWRNCKFEISLDIQDWSINMMIDGGKPRVENCQFVMKGKSANASAGSNEKKHVIIQDRSYGLFQNCTFQGQPGNLEGHTTGVCCFGINKTIFDNCRFENLKNGVWMSKEASEGINKTLFNRCEWNMCETACYADGELGFVIQNSVIRQNKWAFWIFGNHLGVVTGSSITLNETIFPCERTMTFQNCQVQNNVSGDDTSPKDNPPTEMKVLGFLGIALGIILGIVTNDSEIGLMGVILSTPLTILLGRQIRKSRVESMKNQTK